MAHLRHRFTEFYTNQQVMIISALAGLVGIALLYVSSCNFWGGHQTWQIFVRTLGSLIFVSVSVNLLWQLFGKRVFLDEILEKAEISKEIKSAGIIAITNSFQSPTLDWAKYFKSVRKLDIFFAYGRTWRHTHEKELQDFVRRGGRLRVVLPDPENNEVVEGLSSRFNYKRDETQKQLREAKEFFESLHGAEGADGNVSIWYFLRTPLFSFYRFDDTAILALYSHQKSRVQIPTLVCETGGTLYEFLYTEFNSFIEKDGTARQVFPNK